MAALDEHYLNPELAALYDADCGWSIDRDFYLSLADRPEMNVLDLGCGTGLLCDAYAAQGHRVTGVDPAGPMLDVARRAPNGERIEWVLSSAEDYRSDRRFDLVIMTGHAFQAITDEAAMGRVLATMREHLAPGGRVVFESRNPAIDWVARWEGQASVQPAFTREVRNVRWRGDQMLSFDQFYLIAERQIVSHSTLRFWSGASVEAGLVAAGLRLEGLYGDWHRGPFDPRYSDEMIFVAGAGA